MSTRTAGLVLFASLFVASCAHKPNTRLIYFGFDDRAEMPQNVIQLAQRWGENPPCAQWRATLNRKDADYEVLFGTADVTITDRRGQVLYSGGQGVLYMAHGNPDGTGANICKLTGE